MNENEQKQILGAEDEIDLLGFLAGIWHRRLLIAGGTLLLTLLAAIYALTLPRVYRSQAVINLGSISLPDFKIVSERIYDNARILELLRWSASFKAEEQAGLEAKLSLKEVLEQAIEPLPALSSTELRQFSGLPYNEKGAAIIGLRLSWTASEPGKAAQGVEFLARHVRGSMFYDKIFYYINNSFNNVSQVLLDVEGEIIKLRLALERQRAHLDSLKRISRQYPAAKDYTGTQMLSHQEGGYRYFPLVVQQVGLEVAIAGQEQSVLELQRDLELNSLRMAFFSRAQQKMANLPLLTEPLLNMLKSVQSEFFTEQDQELDQVKLVSLEIAKSIKDFEYSLDQKHRIIAGPTLPKKHFSQSRKAIVLRAFLISFLLFLLMALALNWWQKHGARIKDGYGDQVK